MHTELRDALLDSGVRNDGPFATTLIDREVDRNVDGANGGALLVNEPDAYLRGVRLRAKSYLPGKDRGMEPDELVRQDERDVTTTGADPKLAVVTAEVLITPVTLKNCAVVLSLELVQAYVTRRGFEEQYARGSRGRQKSRERSAEYHRAGPVRAAPRASS